MANTQSMERPGSLGRLPTLKTALAVITGVMMLVDLYFIFMVAPTDSVLGHVQRVFYFHVPIAIMSFLAFFVVFIGSLMYLIKRTPKWDAIAHASAEVGVVFVTLALLTGIIWARPIWNTCSEVRFSNRGRLAPVRKLLKAIRRMLTPAQPGLRQRHPI